MTHKFSYHFFRNAHGVTNVIVFFAFIVGIFFIRIPYADAIGISPPKFTIPSILRNTTQKKSITIVRSPDDVGDLHIEVEPGGDHPEFIKTGKDEFILYAGQKIYTYNFEINSQKTANGEYDVMLSFLKTPEKILLEKGTGSIIKTGATAQIHVVVGGEEKLSYELKSVFAEATEIDKEVTIKYITTNTGNVDWQADKIVLAFEDESDNSIVDTYEVSGENVPVIFAGDESKESSIIASPKLPEGKYFVRATFFDKGIQVGGLLSKNTFDVFPEGTLKQDGELKSLSTNKTVYSRGDKVKVDAVFINKGQIPVKATLFSNLYHNEEFIDLIKGKEYAVKVNEELVMTDVLDLKDDGAYKIDSYVEYGNRKTDIKTAEFTVGKVKGNKNATESNSSFVLVVVGLVVLILTLIVIIVLPKMRLKKKLPKNKLSKRNKIK